MANRSLPKRRRLSPKKRKAANRETPSQRLYVRRILAAEQGRKTAEGVAGRARERPGAADATPPRPRRFAYSVNGTTMVTGNAARRTSRRSMKPPISTPMSDIAEIA